MKTLTLLAALAAAMLIPAAAHANVETASHDTVSASLNYQPARYGVEGAQLTITRAGVVAYDEAIGDVICDDCAPAGDGDLFVRDLNDDGEDEVIVYGDTGDDGCCVEVGIYSYDPTSGTYLPLVANWGSVGMEIRDLDGDGIPELIGSDTRFQDLFTIHAASFEPPAVFEFDGEALNDVTTDFPDLITHNASVAMHDIRRLGHRDPGAGGVVAAYVADQFLLGRGSRGVGLLNRLVRQGVVTRSYRTRLMRVLHRYDYR